MMLRNVFLLASLVFVTTPTGAVAEDKVTEPTASTTQRPFYLGGIQLNEDDHQRWSAALIQAGMNAVEVTAYAHQGPWNSADLWYSEQEPAVLAEIRAARENGLQVVLILRIALDHNDPANRFLWHGLIYPESEEELALWFRRYTDFVLKWARIAAAEGVQVLGVASEMNALCATLPVAEIPPLADYYLDEAKQTELRQLVQRHKNLFTDEVRVAMGAGDFTSLDTFLEQRNQAERRWARLYTFAPDATAVDDAEATDSGVEATRLEQINHRRKLLDLHWQALIREVREVYLGHLTLAANFDNYHEVGFWNHLDLIGINAYFPLRASLDSPLTEDALKASWLQVFTDIEAFRQAHGLSQEVVFTELGYTQRKGVTFAPWSSRGFVPIWEEREDREDSVLLWSAQPLAPKERALAVRGLFAAWRDGDAENSRQLPLAGILYWKLSSRLDLGRYEPFMLYLGKETEDPLFNALTLFADPVRPFTDPIQNASRRSRRYLRLAEAILRDDLAAVTELTAERSHRRTPKRALPPLHLAVKSGRSLIVRRLLEPRGRRGTAERDSQTRSRDQAGFLPLHWSCFQEDSKLVEVLLPRPGNIRRRISWRDQRGETPLIKCARLDNVAVMGELLQHRPDLVDVPNLLSQSPLWIAADQASDTMIELLLAHGATPDEPDKGGVTPLHVAARRGDARAVELLSEASTTDFEDSNGNRPIDYAAYYGKGDAFRALWRANAASEKNSSRQSLLHLAAHGGDVEIVRLLLNQGLAINEVDREGKTPLHFAVSKTHHAATRLLLEHKADQRLSDREGKVPIHLAASQDAPQLLRLLLDDGANVELADGTGNAPLHHAAGWGRIENVRLLVAAGASPDLLNHQGQTALEVAEESGRKRVVELLQTLADPGPVPTVKGPEEKPERVVLPGG